VTHRERMASSVLRPMFGTLSDACLTGDPRVKPSCPLLAAPTRYRFLRTPVVVGVNASHTFSSGTLYYTVGTSYFYGARSVTNWHTRTDGVSGLRVGAWLQTLGVTTVCTRGDC